MMSHGSVKNSGVYRGGEVFEDLGNFSVSIFSSIMDEA